MTPIGELATDRFLLRPLQEADVTERYLAWLTDPAARRYISSAQSTQQMRELREYVQARQSRADVVFLGIFDRQTGLHIGNVKYEPVDEDAGFAIMGILIGDADWRSRGVAQEVLRASTEWLFAHRGIGEIVLGVHDSNEAAIRAYQRAGFVIGPSRHLIPTQPGAITMVLRPGGEEQRQ